VSTCQDCGGYLDDNHKCGARWRRRRRLAIVGLLGALVGAVAPFMVFPGYRGYPWSVGTLMVLGAMLALSVWQAIPKR
jgi:hypothetical protein